MFSNKKPQVVSPPIPQQLAVTQPQVTELTIAKKMTACRFYRDPLRAKIIFNTSYEKLDLSTYVLVDSTLFSLILLPKILIL